MEDGDIEIERLLPLFQLERNVVVLGFHLSEHLEHEIVVGEVGGLILEHA